MTPARLLTAGRLAKVTALWALGSFALTVLLASIAPMAFGMHTYFVRSGSMTPTIDTGDLVITREIHPSEAAVGDIVMFKDPEGTGMLITHRVRAVHERDGRFYFITRGDANTGFEHWDVAASGSLGDVSYRIPKLGYVVGSISSGPGPLVFVVFPALSLCGLGLIRIWVPDRHAPPKPAGK